MRRQKWGPYILCTSNQAEYKKHEDHARENSIVRSLSTSDQNITKPWCQRNNFLPPWHNIDIWQQSMTK